MAGFFCKTCIVLITQYVCTDLNEHEQATHQEAEGAKPIVDAILYLICGVERDLVRVKVQERTPAVQDDVNESCPKSIRKWHTT